VRTNGSGTVTRADIEAKLRSIRDSMEPVGEQAKASVMAVVPVVVAVVVLAAYVAGLRKGKKRRAVIEIRRV
jgi:trans-2-enoyl-CoA reductase